MPAARVFAALVCLAAVSLAEESPHVESVEIAQSEYRFTVDTTEAPDLTEWAHGQLIPVMQKWYPLIVGMLPSEGYTAPKTFSITFTERYKGVAATGGNRIECNPAWYRTQLKGEALGSLVHELVHVAQSYRRGRPPGWLVEGIPDYIRWYLYEPEAKGCEISPKRAASVKHDGSYRISANFLNFVIGKYDKDLIKELNAALREGRYDPALWKTRTERTVEELADEWRKSLGAGTP
jgi:Peptidase of plants and bacteria